MNTDWNLTEEECVELARRRAESHKSLTNEISRIPENLWTTSYSDVSAWCGSEIVEHVLLAEASLIGQVRQHLEDAPNPDANKLLTGKLETLLRVLPGTGKAVAGPRLSTFSGLDRTSVASRLDESRAAFSDLIDQAKSVPVKAIVWENKFFGSLSAYHWMLYVPLHTLRHAAQLGRVATAFGKR